MARDVAARRLQQHGIQPSPRRQQQPPPPSPPQQQPPSARTGHAQNAQNGMYINAGYQQYARNPITGAPAPGSPGGSKLAGLMNGDRARPGTACSSGRSASEAQLNAYRRR